MPERIVVAMSGGVDSSVAAARLADQGFEVIGVTLQLWQQPPGAGRGRCCAPEDVHDARRVADRLGIAHYAFDRREAFRREVVGPFVDDYLQGRTPSPCTRCNQLIKLPTLLRVAALLGAPKVATGHFARVVRDASGRVRLARGVDRHKDQSYYLYALGEHWLQRLELVLGESDKPSVRAEALARGLAGAGKGESQDLCFVPDAGYAQFVEAEAAGRLRPGNIVEPDGKVVGSHGGIHRFTIGQRRGLGVAGPVRYVTGLDPSSGAVRIGPEEALLARALWVDRPVLAAGVRLPMRASVQVRYRHDGQPALLQEQGGRLLVLFDEPVRAATKGQAAVAYDGEVVVGGGVIAEVVQQGVALGG